MQSNTRLLVLTGVHGDPDGKLGDKEDGFAASCEKQVEILKRSRGKDMEERAIEFNVEDVGKSIVSDNGARELDEKKFVDAVRNFKPTVLVLAFCFSQGSELNDLLAGYRAQGRV